MSNRQPTEAWVHLPDVGVYWVTDIEYLDSDRKCFSATGLVHDAGLFSHTRVFNANDIHKNKENALRAALGEVSLRMINAEKAVEKLAASRQKLRQQLSDYQLEQLEASA